MRSVRLPLNDDRSGKQICRATNPKKLEFSIIVRRGHLALLWRLNDVNLVDRLGEILSKSCDWMVEPDVVCVDSNRSVSGLLFRVLMTDLPITKPNF